MRPFMGLTLDQIIRDVQAELEDKLRLRAAPLAVQLRKAGRLLPRRVRRDADLLVRAQALSANPKLARQVDMRGAQGAHRSILAYLEGIDVGAERRNRALGVAASIAFVILFTGVGILTVIVLRDLV